MAKPTSMRNKAYTETEETLLRSCAKVALERNITNTEVARCISPLLDRTIKGIEVKIGLIKQELLQTDEKKMDIYREEPKVLKNYVEKGFTSRPRLEPLATSDVGKRVKAKVYNIMPYGAFCETEDGKTGLIIKGMISNEFVDRVEDYLQIGDVFEAVVVADNINPGKILLNAKALGDIISIEERNK